MKRKLYRELWSLRFHKLLDLERAAAAEYGELLQTYRKNPAASAVVPHLERLLADEKKHAALCEELLAILDRQPVDHPSSVIKKS